jgi:signal transduction histidine kinase
MYGISTVNPVIKWPLQVAGAVYGICLSAVMALQALGRADLSGFSPQFQILIILSFFAFFAAMLAEHKKHGTRYAGRFAASALIIIFFCAAEIFNYWARYVNTIGLIFHIGVLLFIFDLGLIGGKFIKDSIEEAREKNRLKMKIGFMSMILDTRRDQYARLMQDAETVKFMRHDMRHHLNLIGELAREDATKLQEYIQGLSEKLAAAQEKRYCANHVVNAVIAHYLAAAENEGVNVEARLVIPEDTGLVPAMDLCVIVGNFLENALEACRRVKRENRFIRIRSRVASERLSIVVTNSFDGLWREQGGVYLSRKTEGEEAREGVGLSSVKAVCEQHQGIVQYEITDDTWKSSALVHMEEI